MLVLWTDLCPLHRYVEILLFGTHECDLMRKQGLSRCNEDKAVRVGPNSARLFTWKKGSRGTETGTHQENAMQAETGGLYKPRGAKDCQQPQKLRERRWGREVGLAGVGGGKGRKCRQLYLNKNK